MIQLSLHFTLEELIKSDTAKRLGINNTPDAKIISELRKLAVDVLEPIRVAYGKPIIVSSGYRCERLNLAVKGSQTSQHRYGQAADIRSQSDTLADNMILWNVVHNLIKQGKIKVGQAIFEYGKKVVGPDWVHVSTPTSTKRNQILYLGVK